MKGTDITYLLVTGEIAMDDLVLLGGIGATVPVDVGPPPIIIALKPEAPEITSYCHLRREPRVKDWEQRQPNRRRK